MWCYLVMVYSVFACEDDERKNCLGRFLEPKTEKVGFSNPWNFHFFKLSYFSQFADVDFETPKNQTKSSQPRS